MSVIIQIAATPQTLNEGGRLYALRDDGSILMLRSPSDDSEAAEWVLLPAPLTPPAEPV